MTEFINTDCCDFDNDASASSFGWDFQINAGIFLFLKYARDSKRIKIESKLQDIEITRCDGSKILAQAKSSQDYTIAKNARDKFKDAIVSLAKHSASGSQFIYISNIPDTCKEAMGIFNNVILPYTSCLEGIRKDIDEIFVKAQDEIKRKIQLAEGNKKKKLDRVLKQLSSFDKTKLFVSVIYPFGVDENTRYRVIADTVLEFLVNDLNLGRDDAIAIKQRLLDYWQLRFDRNSTIPDANTQKTMSKKELLWPIAVFLAEDINTEEVVDCLSFNPDRSLKNEIKRKMASSEIVYHERFEFTNRVLRDYNDYCHSMPLHTRDVEKKFIRECGSNYYDEFGASDDELTEFLTKLFIYKIVADRKNMSLIAAQMDTESRDVY